MNSRVLGLITGLLTVLILPVACSPEDTSSSPPSSAPPTGDPNTSPTEANSAEVGQGILVTQVIPIDSLLPDATLGRGRLLISGACAAFESEAFDDTFTVVWPSGSVRWAEAGQIVFSGLTDGEELWLELGEKVELTGIELRPTQNIDYIDPPADNCPIPKVAVHAVNP